MLGPGLGARCTAMNKTGENPYPEAVCILVDKGK